MKVVFENSKMSMTLTMTVRNVKYPISSRLLFSKKVSVFELCIQGSGFIETPEKMD